MKYLAFSIFLVVLLEQTFPTDAHGYLEEPSMRSFHPKPGYPQYIGKNELFCGGFSRQWNTNGGKCGVCGDPYDAKVKPHEDLDGKYVSNVIAGTYAEGSILTAKVKLTANHKGWFEFRLCPLLHKGALVTQACLDKHLLYLAKDHETRYTVEKGKNNYSIQLQLPKGVTCEQCVLQWWYKAGNNWGCNKDGRCCTGCKLEQETFVNCADISIKDSGSNSDTSLDSEGNLYPGLDAATTAVEWETEPPTLPATLAVDWETEPPTLPATTAELKTTHRQELLPAAGTNVCKDSTTICFAILEPWISNQAMDAWCCNNCLRGFCPGHFCKCLYM